MAQAFIDRYDNSNDPLSITLWHRLLLIGMIIVMIH